jgi:hypothetical protein
VRHHDPRPILLDRSADGSAGRGQDAGKDGIIEAPSRSYSWILNLKFS